MPLLPNVFDAASHAALSNLDVALEIADRGHFVFPCYSHGPEAKRPHKGVPWRQASSNSPDRIRQWWDRWPDAVPGLDLAKSGILVIDLDGEFGFDDWAEISAGREPDVPFVDTPSGGRHLYFVRGEFEHGNGRGLLPPKRDHQGIDVRGTGGYVIAPGATMLDGRQYIPEGDPLDTAVPVPAWLREILKGVEPAPPPPHPVRAAPSRPVADDRRRAYGEEALVRERDELAATMAGGRNNALNAAAFSLGQLVAGGCLSESDVRVALVAACQANGLLKQDGRRAVDATISSGLRAGKQNPRGPEDDPTIADHGAAIVSRLLEKSDGTVIDTETGEIFEPGAPPAQDGDELPDHLTRPPGLLGMLTDWIAESSRRPQRGLALGAALTIIGTACGRHLAGPTRSGTHLYVIGLAPTGAGKDHALQQIAAVLDACNMRHHIGPSQFISMPAVINFMTRAPLAVCAMDEFGSFLKRINSRRASGFEGAISGILRTAWGASFRPMATPEWAGRQSETISAPALSIYGASTPEEFYGALDGADMSNGVLNRLLIIETRVRPEDREPSQDPFRVPGAIVEGVKAIYNRLGPVASAQLNRHDERPDMHKMAWASGAEAAYRALVEDINRRCDGDVMAQAFYARTSEMAVRLASIYAAGINADRPVVTVEAMEWAAELAMWSALSLSRGAMDHIAENDNQGAAQLVRRVVRDAGGRIRHRDLLRRLNHRMSNRDLKDVIKSLVEAEEIKAEAIRNEAGGRPSMWYIAT